MITEDTALLTLSTWQRAAATPAVAVDPYAARDAQFNNRAQRIAADLWDERRDLEPHEEALLLRVRSIGQDYAAVVGEANRAFGTDSKAALAVEFAARQRRSERYQVALDNYEAARASKVDKLR